MARWWIGLLVLLNAALLAWTLKTLNEDIAKFKTWEDSSDT